MSDLSAGNPRAASVRIQSDPAGRAGGQRQHDLRHAPIPGYVDRDRMILNSVVMEPLTPGALRTICKERRSLRRTQRAMKRNASVAISGIIVFGRGVQADFEALAIPDQDAAYRDVAEAIAARLNTTVTGLVAHRDETAPHAHFQLPAFDLAGNAISSMTKRAVTAELQTITAQVMQRHVVRMERGRSKYDRLRSGANYADTLHRSVQELHYDLPAEIATAQARRDALHQEAGKVAARIAKLQAQEALTAKEIKRLETYERRLRAKQDELAELEAEALRLRHLMAQDQTLAAEARRIADAQWDRASAALDAQIAAEARREALEAEMAQIRDRTLSEAQRAAQGAHRRLMGLAGTPAFEAEPDMEKFNNISRIVMDWRLIREEKAKLAAERREFDTHRDTALGRHGQKLRQQVRQAQEEVARLTDQNRDLHRQLGAWAAFRDLTREVLKALLPATLYDRFRSTMQDRWSIDPRNPDRIKPSPAPRPTSNGPSGP